MNDAHLQRKGTVVPQYALGIQKVSFSPRSHRSWLSAPPPLNSVPSHSGSIGSISYFFVNKMLQTLKVLAAAANVTHRSV